MLAKLVLFLLGVGCCAMHVLGQGLPSSKKVRQSSTSENSPNIALIKGNVTIQYFNCAAAPGPYVWLESQTPLPFTATQAPYPAENSYGSLLYSSMGSHTVLPAADSTVDGTLGSSSWSTATRPTDASDEHGWWRGNSLPAWHTAEALSTSGGDLKQSMDLNGDQAPFGAVSASSSSDYWTHLYSSTFEPAIQLKVYSESNALYGAPNKPSADGENFSGLPPANSSLSPILGVAIYGLSAANVEADTSTSDPYRSLTGSTEASAIPYETWKSNPVYLNNHPSPWWAPVGTTGILPAPALLLQDADYGTDAESLEQVVAERKAQGKRVVGWKLEYVDDASSIPEKN